MVLDMDVEHDYHDSSSVAQELKLIRIGSILVSGQPRSNHGNRP